MTNIDAIQIQIETLALDSYRNGALAEQNRWVRGLTELARSGGTLAPQDIAEFINRMRESPGD